MQDDNDKDYRKLEQVFSEADDAFWDDPSAVFGDEGQKTRKLFDYLKRVWNPWERTGPCMYRGCTDISIRRSHTIHRAGSLERIAEAQHVLTPRLGKDRAAQMERVGVNNASTFPGFCAKHEQLFFEFESTGLLTSPRHIALQAFRTLCREIARKRHGVEHMEKALKEYREARERHFATAVKKFDENATFEGMKIKGDEIDERIASSLSGQKADLAELEGDLYDELFGYIDSQQQDPALQALSLPFEVPVSLSGFGIITYQSGQDKYRALCLLGILPLPTETLVFVGAARKHAAIIEAYREAMEHGFNGLNSIESWVTNGSDHWFIRPSVWDAIPPHRQQKILELLLRDDDNIGTMLEFSILDDARRSIIQMIHDHIHEAPDRAAALNMVRQETAKMV